MTTPTVTPTEKNPPPINLCQETLSPEAPQAGSSHDIVREVREAQQGSPFVSKSSPSAVLDLKSCGHDILILPGWQDSGPIHWQTAWEKKYNLTRIQQGNWETPERDEWIRTIAEYADKCDSPVIVAHSLGCIAVVHALQERLIKPTAVILVAPADTDFNIHNVTATGFDPIPTSKLEYPCLVIASTNDMYMTEERSRFLATRWGAELKMLENQGHINSKSNLGDWKPGQDMVLEFLRKIKRP